MANRAFNWWKYPLQIHKHRAALQSTVFARNWYLFDCKWQDPFDAAHKISCVLQGKHKPIYDGDTDCGDHVVCINTAELAMPAGEWRWRMYYHHSRYAKGTTWAPAFDLHKKDPTIVLYKAVYKHAGQVPGAYERNVRRMYMARLHLYPDANVPKDIMENIVDQLQNVQVVPRAIHQFDKKAVENFPKLADYPDDYVIQKD